MEGCQGILRIKGEDNPVEGQKIEEDRQIEIVLDLVAPLPDVVEEDIEDGHGDGCDQFAHPQGDHIVLHTSGVDRNQAGHQVEGIPCSQ